MALDLNKVLTTVTQLVPVARSLISIISGANAQPNPTQDVLDLIVSLTPVVQNLVVTIEAIRSQTEAQHPEVWKNIRDDWNGTAAEWRALNP